MSVVDRIACAAGEHTWLPMAGGARHCVFCDRIEQGESRTGARGAKWEAQRESWWRDDFVLLDAEATDEGTTTLPVP